MIHLSFVIARQTKTLNLTQTTNRHESNANKTVRQTVDLPMPKPLRGQTKVKSKLKRRVEIDKFTLFLLETVIPPLLKKTLKSYNGKI